MPRTDSYCHGGKTSDADPRGTGVEAGDAHSAARRRAAHLHERENCSRSWIRPLIVSKVSTAAARAAVASITSDIP